VLVGGCQSTSSGPELHAGPTASRTCTSSQQYLVAAGVDENNASLYSVDGCDGTARIFKGISRVSALSTGAHTTVVSSAPVDVDQVFRLVGNRLVAVAGRRAPNGSAPATSLNGTRVAYVALGAPGPNPFTVVEVLANGRSAVVYRTAKPLGALAYGPSGALYVAENAPDPLPGQTPNSATAELLRIQNGVPSSLARLPFPYVTGLAVTGGLVAVSGPETRPGLTLTTNGKVSGSFAPALRVQAFAAGGALVVVSGRRFGTLLMPASIAGQPVWVPLKLDATVVAARPR
jgi:hypothetical protein